MLVCTVGVNLGFFKVKLHFTICYINLRYEFYLLKLLTELNGNFSWKLVYHFHLVGGEFR